MNEIKGFFKSFTYAFNGVVHCIKNERNLRFHLVFLTYMFSILIFTDWFVLSRTDYAILIVVSGMVVTAEIINSAVENAVNLACEEPTFHGKISKDAAAGAVLVSAVFAVITGFVILFQVDAFVAMYNYFKENLSALAILILSLIPSVLLILKGFSFSKGK